jgi:hypothetical protein
VGAENVDVHTVKALLSMSNHPGVQDSRGLPLAVAEIVDARKAEIARSAYAGPIEVLASDTIVAQVTLRPDLNAVFDELFGSGGAEIALQPASKYGLGGVDLGFSEIQTAAMHRGHTAVGVRITRGTPGGDLHFNPGGDARFVLADGDEVVVLATCA